MVGTTISHYKVLEKIGQGVWEKCIDACSKVGVVVDFDQVSGKCRKKVLKNTT
jgi:hypothetical protein